MSGTFTLVGDLSAFDKTTPHADAPILLEAGTYPDTGDHVVYTGDLRTVTDADGSFAVSLLTEPSLYYRISSESVPALFEPIVFAAPAAGVTKHLDELTAFDPATITSSVAVDAIAARDAAIAAAASVAYSTWQPTQVYIAGQTVQAPDGTLIKRITNGTSRASFDLTEQNLWTVVTQTAGTLAEAAAAKTLFGVNVRHPKFAVDAAVASGADVVTAVHAVRDAAGVGAVLYFPPGTYNVATSLVMNVANQQWIFAPGATITQTDTVVARKAVDVNASGASYQGGKVDGGTVSGSSCIFIEPGLTDVKVLSSELVNGQYGVRCKGANATALNTRVRVLSCHVHNQTGNAITFNASTVDSEAVGNEIHDVGGAGVWAGGDGCDRLIITGNHITNITGQGIGLNGVSGGGGPIGAPNSVVSGNTIVSCGAIGISLNCSDGTKCIGNDVKNAGVYGLEIAMSSRCSLVGNTVTTPAGNGISVSAVSLACDDNLIQGNLIIAPGGNGIIMGGSANGAKRTRIIGNEVVDAGNGTPTPAFTNATGIGCTDVVYANNIVRWTPLSGTPSTGFSLNMPNAIVVGNHVTYDAAIATGGGTGIQVAATALNATINSNIIEGNGKCATGVNLVVGVTGVLVVGNNVMGTTVDGYKNNSASTTNHFAGNTVNKTSGNGFNIGVATGAGNRDLSEAFMRIQGGVKIGASAIDTIGFYGVTAIARPTGWAAATGTATRATFATGTVTLSQLAEHVKALEDDLLALGLIGA